MEFNPIEIKKGEVVDVSESMLKVEAANPFKEFCKEAERMILKAGQDEFERNQALEELCSWVSAEQSVMMQGEMIDFLTTLSGKKKTIITSAINKQKKKTKTTQLEIMRPEDEIPNWIDMDKLYTSGFVMNNKSDTDRVGIYYKGSEKPVIRLTNFTVKPLYFIMDPLNPRRLVEIYNGTKTYVIELSARAFVSQDAFEVEVTGKPGFYTEPGFSKIHYKRLVNWLNENTRTVYELKTLGWQSEGFFAFSNKVVNSLGDILEYDEYGIVQVKEVGYLSPSVGKMNFEIRDEDNINENDRYLAYAPSPISFAKWAQMFNSVYEDHAPFGMAFIFISAFKDICTKVTKIPLKYFYGPKGAGKSAMAESMMWFFFSGKNSEGKLIQGYNLNPGQGTHFSFFSRIQRFRNVFMLYNEHDPNTNEPWKRGAFKASYDGEGREVGSGDTGKKRKTEIQKVQCVVGLVGQYLDTTDDGALLSRSVPSKFSLERNKARTDEQKEQWKTLNEFEHEGISGLIVDLLKQRSRVEQNLKEEFWKIQSGLVVELRKRKMLSEARTLNNFSLCLAMVKILQEPLALPFSYDEFYNQSLVRLIEQTKMLKDNNILTSFWNTIEVLVSDNFVRIGYQFDLKLTDHVRIKQEGETTTKRFYDQQTVLYVRLNVLHDKFAKRYREVSGKQAPDTDTITTYLKDQPYFIGLCPGHQFKDMNTSCYVVNYDELKLMGVVLERNAVVVEEEPKFEDGGAAPF